ncbi:hypothetical protein P4S55_07180 [Shewanella sp. PP-Sp27a-2]
MFRRTILLSIFLSAASAASIQPELQPESQPDRQLESQPASQPLQHYIYINHREANGENIRADKALRDPRFGGAQIVYTYGAV